MPASCRCWCGRRRQWTGRNTCRSGCWSGCGRNSTPRWRQLQASGQPLGVYLKARNPAWNLVGRVHVHLAENRKDERVSLRLPRYLHHPAVGAGEGTAPALGEALREYAAAADKERLLALLAHRCDAPARAVFWLKGLIDRREIFQALRWSAGDALTFLHDVPELEHAGVVVRMPAQWAGEPALARHGQRHGRSSSADQLVGQDALLDFQVSVAIDREPLTAAEVQGLLADSRGLVFIRGRMGRGRSRAAEAKS